MCYRWSVFSRIEFLCKSVKWLRVVAEVGDVEDCFGIGKVQTGEIGVQSSLRRSKVWYTCRGTYPCPYLSMVSMRSQPGLSWHLTMTTIFCARPTWIYCARASNVRAFSVCGGVFGSTIVDSSLPILPFLPLPRPFSALRQGLFCCACWRCGLCFRPILKDWRFYTRNGEARGEANVAEALVMFAHMSS